jgi:hypothetical protein
LPDPPGVVSVEWSVVSGPGSVGFGDSGLVETTAVFGVSGVYVVRLGASDGELTGSAEASITIGGTPPPSTEVFEVRVGVSGDDVEEYPDGFLYTDSSDLELVTESDPQLVGLRFVGVEVPRGAVVSDAWVQFTVDEVSGGGVSLVVRGEASGDAAVFSGSGAVSSRVLTGASVVWEPPSWDVVGAAGVGQRTPDLSGVVQEVVDHPGWVSGNALVLVVSGSGSRVAESFDGSSGSAPLLHVEFSVGPPPPVVNEAPVVGWVAGSAGCGVGGVVGGVGSGVGGVWGFGVGGDHGGVWGFGCVCGAVGGE